MKTVRIAMVCLMLLSLITQVGAFAQTCPEHEKTVSVSVSEQGNIPSFTESSSHDCHSDSAAPQVSAAGEAWSDELCQCPQHGCSHAPSIVSGLWSPQFVSLAEKIAYTNHFYSPLLIGTVYRPPTVSC